jgi:hypothetical protein
MYKIKTLFKGFFFFYLLASIFLLLLLAPRAEAACTVLLNSRGANISECAVNWTSNASGAVSATITTPAGKVLKIETIPGTAGDRTTNLPTNLYDITLTDPYSLDIAAAGLADRSGTVAQNIVPSTPYPISGNLTANITNAGDSKQGRIIVTVEE